jgi:hypothetical protein
LKGPRCNHTFTRHSEAITAIVNNILRWDWHDERGERGQCWRMGRGMTIVVIVVDVVVGVVVAMMVVVVIAVATAAG